MANDMAGGRIQKATGGAVMQKKDSGMAALVKSMQGEIAKALPSVLTPERFTRITLSALSGNRKLQECTPNSFLGAMMTAAQLGVEPNTPLGQAYLIPYRNHGQMECQFQLGYKGLLDLVYRSGEVRSIQAHEVYENDEFEYQFGLEPTLTHVPAQRDRGEVTHYYAIWKGKDGAFGFEVMSRENVEMYGKKFSKSYGNSPWQTNFDEMAKKTVLKKALKYAPIKSDFATAVSVDETYQERDTETGDIITAGWVEVPSGDAEDVEPEAIDVNPETGKAINNG